MHRTIAEARARYGRLTHAKRNGARIVIARPANPAAHVAIANLALDKQDPAILDAVMDETFTFVGYLAFATKREPYVVDEDGGIVDHVATGDSAFDERAVRKPD